MISEVFLTTVVILNGKDELTTKLEFIDIETLLFINGDGE
jgi:hypothetical protein